FTTGYGGVSGDYQRAYTHINQNHDGFGKTFDITVTDKALEQSVELNRIVGKIGIKVLDNIPTDIGRIVFSITGISSIYYFYGGSRGTGDTFEKAVNTTSSNIENQMFLYFGYQGYETSSGHATVNIRAYGKEGNLVINKVVNDVPVGV